jgi:hypothetical protein
MVPNGPQCAAGLRPRAVAPWLLPAANRPRPLGSVGTVPSWTLMHKRKPYKGSICGAEVPSLPMPVLKHQMSHVKRRP